MSTLSKIAASLTLSAVWPVEACVALALAEDALAAARAALRAVATPSRVGGRGDDKARHEGDLAGAAVVVVQREEPVARRQEVARRLGHRRLEE